MTTEPTEPEVDLSALAALPRSSGSWNPASSKMEVALLGDVSESNNFAEAEVPLEVDYRTFQRFGIQTSLGTAIVRLVIFFAISARQGAPVSIRYFLDLIPYPVVEIDGAGFASLVSRSTLFTTIVILAFFVISSFRNPSRNQKLVGRFMGILSCAEMLLVDTIRHLISPPVIVASTALWTLWPLALGVIVLLVVGRASTDSVNETESIRLDSATSHHLA